MLSCVTFAYITPNMGEGYDREVNQGDVNYVSEGIFPGKKGFYLFPVFFILSL